ncbi:alanine--tRNA ligase, mitochondrial [Bombyx mori]|uniref:alanine--tRNA ligase n=1 Tax=Bombyx mori TaxID=7091 RepID=A0A8R2CAB3_BOMMO|nr:alanine--tRNA ligase, mitochondrial [Bombyx mori]XP_037876260.1 alanine--tRNA ligase, mitochondrial [Bombyx mori]
MLRVPVRKSTGFTRMKSTSSIRNTFIKYFIDNHAHKFVKSSSVVPLCDPTVPFVNAGMNQFKGVFLGTVNAPCPRAVNSQKCIRVGGKHNDLDLVGTDSHHHTFFEMLGNWSFGDYYKKEACQMAWDLLLGPYRLKPDDLVVTYFAGDPTMKLNEDRECRDIWKSLGVSPSRIKGLGASDNFWEMGLTGPCGPCTEIHVVNPDGSLTEIWNLVFIQFNRETDGSVTSLSRHHVDTGMGLERMAKLLQGVPSNYDTDIFKPLIKAIEKNSKNVPAYSGQYTESSTLDCAYRRLADHSRMISVCLADGVFPANSLNVKQIMRKSFKICSDVFNNPHLLSNLYDEVAATLGSTYPELVSNKSSAKLIIEHEAQAYAKMRAGLVKKWKDLVMRYPEVESLNDVETPGFALGYKEFKETVSKLNTSIIPGELIFKLYDTHGLQEELINRIAELNNMTTDKEGFQQLLSKHKHRHKTAFKEQALNKTILFNDAIDRLIKNGISRTNDLFKYNYEITDSKLEFKTLTTKLCAILNEDCQWIDVLDTIENRPYYLVTEDTNFYCEEGGQISDSGVARIDEHLSFKVDSVFKIRDFVFHKGCFLVDKNYSACVKCGSDVTLIIDGEKRLRVIQNHTAIHLLNAAIRKALPNSVVSQIGSKVTDRGLYLNLSVYGEKLSEDVLLAAECMIRESIESNARIETKILDSVQLALEDSVVTVPGETYPETGLRLVIIQEPLISKELCCGTHAPSAGALRDVCITQAKGLGTNAPTVYCVSGEAARQARELFCRTKKLEEVVDLMDPERLREEVADIRRALGDVCGDRGAPRGELARCLTALRRAAARPAPHPEPHPAPALQAIAEAEIREAIQEAVDGGRRFVVQFVRCSYLMQDSGLACALRSGGALPALLLGCAGGVIHAQAHVPKDLVTQSFTAERWLGCILPVFRAAAQPPACGDSALTRAAMTPTKVSLIDCEDLVQDAMRAAIRFAQAHAHAPRRPADKNRQHN